MNLKDIFPFIYITQAAKYVNGLEMTEANEI